MGYSSAYFRGQKDILLNLLAQPSEIFFYSPPYSKSWQRLKRKKLQQCVIKGRKEKKLQQCVVKGWKGKKSNNVLSKAEKKNAPNIPRYQQYRFLRNRICNYVFWSWSFGSIRYQQMICALNIMYIDCYWIFCNIYCKGNNRIYKSSLSCRTISTDISDPLSPPSLLSIASGRSSGLHPVSAQSCCI